MKPEISTTQSVIGYRQWTRFIFQPFATNDPSYWTSSPLPPGAVIDGATGRITARVTTPGVFVFSLRAGNPTGESDPVEFTMGIEPAGSIEPANVTELFVDLTPPRPVSLSRIAAADFTKPLLSAKRGDDLIFHIVFLKNGVPADLDISTLKIGVKNYETESVILEGYEWQKIGEGEDAAFRLFLKLDSDELDSALSEFEDDAGTTFVALAELEWVENNSYSPHVGTPHIRSTSKTFGLQITRDLITDADPLV